MLETHNSRFVANCDFCLNVLETDELDFRAAVDAMKREGWKVYRSGGEWFHKCDACLETEDADDFEEVE